MVWCKAALRHGFTLIRDTGIITWHYHFSSYQYQFKIKLTVGYLQYREFDFVPAYPSVIQSVKFITAKLIKEQSVNILKKLYTIIPTADNSLF